MRRPVAASNTTDAALQTRFEAPEVSCGTKRVPEAPLDGEPLQSGLISGLARSNRRLVCSLVAQPRNTSDACDGTTPLQCN